MRKVNWLLVVAALLLVVVPVFAGTPQKATSNSHLQYSINPQPLRSVTELDDPIWTEDWENGENGWEFADGLVGTDFYWFGHDWTPHGGTYAWHCADPDAGDNGGYASHWLQWLTTPEMDLTGTSAPSVDFWFKLSCEDPGGEPDGYDAWDGANVWVFYTDGNGDPQQEVLTPDDGTVPYTATSMYSFGNEWFMGTGIPGWGGTTDYVDWQNVTMDLTDYIDYDDVQVSFVFCSDPSYDTSNDAAMFGFMVDDVVISDGATTLFEDDAEDAANSDFTFMSGLISNMESAFFIAESDTCPSPTHMLAMEDDGNSFLHYWVSPDIDLTDVELAEGEELWLDTYVRGGFTCVVDQEASWTVKIWSPEAETWYYATNVNRGTSNYVFVDAPAAWSLYSATYSTPWILNEVVGEVIKIRVEWAGPIEGYTDFQGVYFDDFFLEVQSIEHDIATTPFNMPFPTTVGFPVMGQVDFVNQGINEETFNALWYLGTDAALMDPPPPYTLTPGENMTVTIGSASGWTPDEAGDFTVMVRHLLADDQVTSNDTSEVDITVQEEGVYELGEDGRSVAYYVPDTGENGGIVMYYEMPDGLAPLALENVTYMWYDLDWPDGVTTADVAVHIYDANGPGGDLGTELYTETFTVNSGEGYPALTVFELPDEEVIVEGDFYVWLQNLQVNDDSNSYPYFLGDDEMWGAENFFVYDGTTMSDTDLEYYLRVFAAAYDGVESVELGSVPTQFKLAAAYPNPFNPTTTLSFDVASKSHISLVAYNVMGQEVARLIDKQMSAGTYQVTFNAEQLSSGTYFVRMEAENFTSVQKVMLLK